MEATEYRAPRQPLVPPGGIDCHLRDMTATMSADLTLKQVQESLAQHQQWLPIDGDAERSIGALVAADSTGPLRLGYGAWRDLLLGVQFRNGRGELITAGGRTVKNVAGYDLTKLMVGQRGIFGSLVTVTTRTYRRPAGAIIARHPPQVQVLSRLIPTSLRPQWAILTRDALWCGYLGDEPTLAFYRSAVPQTAPPEMRELSMEEEIAFRGTLWSAGGKVTFRASVPPGRLGDFAAKLPHTKWAADAAFGAVLGEVESEAARSVIRETAREIGGTVRFFSGMYEAPLELSTSDAERRIIERLKHAFDPHNNLEPLPWRTS